MFSLIKKLVFLLVAFWIVGSVINVKLGGRPMREWNQQIWAHETVQNVYQTVRDKLLAVLNKDISVEEVFQSKDSSSAQKKSQAVSQNKKEIHLEKLSQKDREALEKILQKAQ